LGVWPHHYGGWAPVNTQRASWRSGAHGQKKRQAPGQCSWRNRQEDKDPAVGRNPSVGMKEDSMNRSTLALAAALVGVAALAEPAGGQNEGVLPALGFRTRPYAPHGSPSSDR